MKNQKKFPKKLFLAGAKFSDIPLISAAHKMGFFVVTSGNNPHDLGHEHGDRAALEDYSNKEAMLSLVRREAPSALLQSCDDFSALTCAFVAENLGLGGFDSFEVAKTIHHKHLWRDFCARNGIDSPRAMGFNESNLELEKIKAQFGGAKIIIKPVDSAAGKGVSVLDLSDSAALKTALDFALSASKSRQIVIEEFIEGTRHGFSAILIAKKVVLHFADDEQYAFNPFAVSGTTTSVSITPTMAANLIAEIEKIAALLDLKDGIFHTQTIAKTLPNGAKKLVIIEACRRGGGDLHLRFVGESLGLDYAQIMLCAHLGLPLPKIAPAPKPFYARQCVMSREAGILESVEFSREILRNLRGKFMWHRAGDKIEDTRRYKAGIVFLEFESRAEMEDKIARLDKLICVKTRAF